MNVPDQQGRLCDVRFRIGNEVFPAHRVILAAQAEVLEEVLHLNILERNEEEIVLENVDTQVLRETLDFIYFRRHEINKVAAA